MKLYFIILLWQTKSPKYVFKLLRRFLFNLIVNIESGNILDRIRPSYSFTYIY